MKRSNHFVSRSTLGVLIGLMASCIVPAMANQIVDTSGFSLTTMSPNDDGYSSAVPLGFTANFFGVTETQAYVNTNGNITFGSPQSTYTPYGLTSSLPSGIQGIIAPFFADVDTAVGGNPVSYGTGTYDGHNAFVVNWPGVAYFANADKVDTFQLVLVDQSATGAGNFDIYFNYGSMQWDTGSASGGVDGLCTPSSGDSAAVGYSNGSGSAGTNYELPGSHVCGAFIDGGPNALMTGTNDGMPGQYLFQVRSGEVIQPPSSVPEPATLALFAAGLAGIAFVVWRRKPRAHRL